MRWICRLGLAFALLVAGSAQGAEESPREKIARGVALHDKGLFDEAAALYREVLAVEPNNWAAHYELAYSESLGGKHEECVKHAERALKTAKAFRAELHAVAAGCYDQAGQPKKAVKLYAKGLEEFPGNSNLAFNFAITQLGLKRYKESRELAKVAITGRPDHASSYQVLAIAYHLGGYRLPSLLASLRFLSIEPAGQRAATIATHALQLLHSDVSKKGENNVEVFLDVSQPTDEGDFKTVATMMSLISASRFLEENKNKSESELLAVEVQALLEALAGEDALVAPGKFVSDRLVLPLVEISRAGLGEAFAYVAFSSIAPAGNAAWIEGHPKETAALAKMLRAQS